jgi:CelD/BcsL family acetyltransferase involved in cellulose biosynthesis
VLLHPDPVHAVTRATPLTAFGNATVTIDAAQPPAAHRMDVPRELSAHVSLAIHSELAAVESEWRRFETVAECTAFQSFDWLAMWQRHIGQRQGVIPAIVVGSFADGETAFILPLAVAPTRGGRRLCWLGQDLCDYAAPLLARDFSQRVSPGCFRAVWQDLQMRLRRDHRLRHDWIVLEKMPQRVGSQINPFTNLKVTTNANGAHLTQLGHDWQKFYFEKRSSATRRHDRAKRRHMSGYGEIRFVNSSDPDDARRMIEMLMQQKSRSLARKGIPNVFARPGCREFLLDLAANPKTRNLIHISRIEIGTIWAAVNFGIVFGDCYYHFVASFDDSEVAHYGPGALHLRELMAYSIGLGLRRFDFTIGDEPYKREWSDSHLTLHDFVAAVTWRGWPGSCCDKVRLRLKRFIKNSPAAWSLVCSVRSSIGFVRTRPP